MCTSHRPEAGADSGESLAQVQVRLGVAAPVAAMRAAGRDYAESKMFACPGCGHINPDHRWTGDFDCLIDGCGCLAFGPIDVGDDQLDPLFDAAWGNT